MIGEKVLVRDHKAGVHVGILEAFDPATKTCKLAQVRKVWYWSGAASCHGIAARGLDTKASQIAPLVSCVISCDVVEIVAMTPEAWEIVQGAPEWAP